MAKREHIPETADVKPNREQRRHPERVEDAPLARDPTTERPFDVEDPRTKSSGHKKKTADKWNQ